MNTENYIINKFLLKNLNLNNEGGKYTTLFSLRYYIFKIIYFNTLLFEQVDLHMCVVPNLVYEYVVHDGSIHTNTK